MGRHAMGISAVLLCVSSRAALAEDVVDLPCQSTADCGALRCVEGRCIDPFRRAAPIEVSTGVHGFIGVAIFGGPALGGVLGSFGRWDSAPQGSFIFALRAGVLIGRSELAIEVSPFTYVYYRGAPGPAFQVNATYGYLIPLFKESSSWSAYWPIRIGGGFFAGNVGGDVYAQIRGDFVGVTIRKDHILIDGYLPSFRYAVTSVNGETPNVLSWELGASASYVF